MQRLHKHQDDSICPKDLVIVFAVCENMGITDRTVSKTMRPPLSSVMFLWSLAVVRLGAVGEIRQFCLFLASFSQLSHALPCRPDASLLGGDEKCLRPRAVQPNFMQAFRQRRVNRERNKEVDLETSARISSLAREEANGLSQFKPS